MKVFLSCASKEFGSYRRKLCDHLRSIRGDAVEVRSQEDFQQGPFTLLERLAEYVSQCDLVIHLVGDVCGAIAGEEHVCAAFARLERAVPEPVPQASYTQWEYRFARMFDRKVYCYMARPGARRDCVPAEVQTAQLAMLQLAYRHEIELSGEHRSSFSNHGELIRTVLDDLGIADHQKINNLPYVTLGSLFKGRAEFLTTLRERLGDAEHKGHLQVKAITAATRATLHGMGGVGKTRAAVEFAHEFADEYTALLFVQADSKETFDDNLARLCGAAVLNLAEDSETETSRKLAAVERWLKLHPGWFLILDNVDSPEAQAAVTSFLGRLGNSGQTVITSRISQWPGGFESLELDLLEVGPATEFLLEKTERFRPKVAEDQRLAGELVVVLGQLALALEQAGAYINATHSSFADYLRVWKKHDEVVWEWFDKIVMEYPRSVATTWATSFDQLGAPARRLLQMVSWFAPEPIPVSILKVGEGPQLEGKPDAETERPRLALGELARFSLATFQQNHTAFAVHKLVQEVTRTRLSVEDGNATLEASLRWMAGAYVGHPQDVRTWPALAPLAPHAIQLADEAGQAGISGDVSYLLSQSATLRQFQAQFSQAEPLMRRALAIDEASYGADHPRIAIHLNNLAQLLKATNRLAEAEPLMRRALAIDEASYGADHPDVAIDLNNLASLLHATNRLAEAEPLMRRALAIDEASYGADHPRVAIDLNNLAQLLQATNRLAEAEPLMRRALEIDEGSYGADHPKVAIRLNNLASLLHATNRLAEAEPLMRRALAIDEGSYGADHPDVAIDLNNLAQLLKATNRLAEAEPLMCRALAILCDASRRDGYVHPNLEPMAGNYWELLGKMGFDADARKRRLHEIATEFFAGPEGNEAVQ